jgi:hypothetical protein
METRLHFLGQAPRYVTCHHICSIAVVNQENTVFWMSKDSIFIVPHHTPSQILSWIFRRMSGTTITLQPQACFRKGAESKGKQPDKQAIW